MTLQGINWFAIAITVALDMFIWHVAYKPFLIEHLGTANKEFDQSIQARRKRNIYLFITFLALSLAIWNLLLIPQFSGRYSLMIVIGIWIPFFLLPRLVTVDAEQADAKLFSLERLYYFMMVLFTEVILDYVVKNNL